MSSRAGGVLCLMPKDARRSTGPVSLWLTAAGWAEAAADVRGASWVQTPSGILSAAEARSIATSAPQPTLGRRGWRRHIPTVVSTLVKDARSWEHARRFRDAGAVGPWEEFGLSWVWHHHELFHDSGFHAGAKFGCPVVVFVDAPVVWEGRKWGVKRPGWGRLVEAIGERPQLRRADLVACVTDEVAEAAVAIGARADDVIVTPCAVDTARFHPGVSGEAVRQAHGLDGKTTIGWIGTFHKFHGLDLLVEAYAALEKERDDVCLVLVGDGQDRPRVEQLLSELGVRNVVLTGVVPQDAVPAHLAAFDVATVVDPGFGTFHYSPLKLKEYLACGRAVVAPSSGQIGELVETHDVALLVPPGDSAALTAALIDLVDSPTDREDLGRRGAALIAESGTWRHQVVAAETALEKRGA